MLDHLPVARPHARPQAKDSEAIALTIGDFDPLAVDRPIARGTTNCIKTKRTKGRKRRTSTSGSELVAVLPDMLTVRRQRCTDDGGWLIPVSPPRLGRYALSTEPRPPHHKTVRDWHEQALVDAGLLDLPLHGLHHTAAALWPSTGRRSLEFVRAAATTEQTSPDGSADGQPR
jgi:integrase